MPDTVTLQIYRYRPERSHAPVHEAFEIPFRPEWTVLDGLNHVKRHLDTSVSYRWSCRMGVCGSCGMEVDGEPVLTCAMYLEDCLPGPVRIEPLRGFPVIRDLVGDLSDFVTRLREVRPWIIRTVEEEDEAPFRQTPEELERFTDYSHCINCMLCYAACPVHELDPAFLGPAAIALAQRYNLDSRDQGADERAPVLGARNGVWPCTFVGECSAVCPKGVDPAGAIQRYKATAAARWLRSLLPGGNP
jgi:fumarate reductase iron-sulfur subunit